MVLNIPHDTMQACNASATGPDSKTQTTSVQNEMAQNGLYLEHHGEGQDSSECKHFPAILKNMSNDLRPQVQRRHLCLRVEPVRHLVDMDLGALQRPCRMTWFRARALRGARVELARRSV